MAPLMYLHECEVVVTAQHVQVPDTAKCIIIDLMILQPSRVSEMNLLKVDLLLQLLA